MGHGVPRSPEFRWLRVHCGERRVTPGLRGILWYRGSVRWRFGTTVELMGFMLIRSPVFGKTGRVRLRLFELTGRRTIDLNQVLELKPLGNRRAVIYRAACGYTAPGNYRHGEALISIFAVNCVMSHINASFERCCLHVELKCVGVNASPHQVDQRSTSGAELKYRIYTYRQVRFRWRTATKPNKGSAVSRQPGRARSH